MKRRVIRGAVVGITLIFTVNIVTWAETSNSLKDKIENNKESINKLENEKDKVNSEKENQSNELNGILNNITEQSKSLEAAKSDVKFYQDQIDDVQKEIDGIEYKISQTENEIQSKEGLIKEKEKEVKLTEEMLAKRVRSYYKMDINTQYIYMLLRSQSFSSLFSTIDNIFRIINIDKGLIKQSKELKKNLEEEKEALAKTIKEIEVQKETVVAKKNELKGVQKEFIAKQEEEEKQMNKLMALESQKSNLVNSLSEKEKEIANKIGDLISYNKELQQELDNIFASINSSNNQANNNSGNTGESAGGNTSGGVIGDPSQESFLRPGYGVVTDPYGPRINPVTGQAGFHTGVDLGDAEGSNVKASKSGTVAYVGWISGYGNTVIIDHGQGVQTLYAHNNSLLVSVGQKVARGQNIALVGSTGMSTGPHIHWEIRINGQHTNPMGYV
ncbi:M23 family metallopeptidase [Clostridium carnis]